MPSIPFPGIKMKLKDPEDIEFHGSQWTTWKEWYGDLNQCFHLLVHTPVFEFCQSRIKTKSTEITYDQAREMFYEHDKKFFDWESSITAGHPDAAAPADP